MERVLNANKQYRALRALRDTGVVIREPVIGSNGFTVLVEETIGGDSNSFELYVHTNKNARITKDLAAVTMAALVLRKYKNVHFDFDVGEATLKEAERLTLAGVTAKETRADNIRLLRDRMALNFSGGADSLALHLICPELLPVSVDFLENVPEKDVFAGLSNHVVETNAAFFLFPHYPVGYYNLGTLLFADSEGIGLTVDSRIMTDDLTVFQFLDGETQTVLSLPDTVYDTRIVYPLAGMTKAGTLNVLNRLRPELLNNALAASTVFEPAPGRMVLLRLLLECLTGVTRDMEPARHFIYGDNKLFDFYAVYLVNKLGAERTALYVHGIPENIITLAESPELDFYEKYDARALKNIPPGFADYFTGRLQIAGVELYTEEDYAERGRVLAALGIGGGA